MPSGPDHLAGGRRPVQSLGETGETRCRSSGRFEQTGDHLRTPPQRWPYPIVYGASADTLVGSDRAQACPLGSLRFPATRE